MSFSFDIKSTGASKQWLTTKGAIQVQDASPPVPSGNVVISHDGQQFEYLTAKEFNKKQAIQRRNYYTMSSEDYHAALIAEANLLAASLRMKQNGELANKNLYWRHYVLQFMQRKYGLQFHPNTMRNIDRVETGMNRLYGVANFAIAGIFIAIAKAGAKLGLTFAGCVFGSFWNYYDTAAAIGIGRREALLGDQVAANWNYFSAAQLFVGTLYADLVWAPILSLHHGSAISSSVIFTGTCATIAAASTASFCFVVAMAIPWYLEHRAVKRIDKQIRVIDELMVTEPYNPIYLEMRADLIEEREKHDFERKKWKCSTFCMLAVSIIAIAAASTGVGLGVVIGISICAGIFSGIIRNTSKETYKSWTKCLPSCMGGSSSERMFSQQDGREHHTSHSKHLLGGSR